MPVTLPNIDPRRELARKLFDAAISQVPWVGGPYAAMLSVTHPAESEKLLAAWRADVTAALNNMEAAISAMTPTFTLSPDASAIGYWMSANSQLGRRDLFDFDRLKVEFPDASKRELEDACGELALAGLATTSAAIGRRILDVSPTVRLFEVFDPVTQHGANPLADAALLARRILAADSSSANTGAMMKELGWTPRRYNPAISIVCEFIGEGRRSGEADAVLAFRQVFPDPAERARLRRFADSVLGRS